MGIGWFSRRLLIKLILQSLVPLDAILAALYRDPQAQGKQKLFVILQRPLVYSALFLTVKNQWTLKPITAFLVVCVNRAVGVVSMNSIELILKSCQLSLPKLIKYNRQ